jgi:pimeloyl-ACP methyl ester carboxylesterase
MQPGQRHRDQEQLMSITIREHQDTQLVISLGFGLKMAADSAATQSSPDMVRIPWRDAPLAVELRRGEPTAGGAPSPVVVFVNGLGSGRASWSQTTSRLPKQYTLLTYSRFGQDDTPRLPDDVPEELRDGAAAARDLGELVRELARREGPGFDLFSSSAPVVFVAHSIGVAIARLLFASGGFEDVAAAVGGALFLDPSIVNSDFVSLFPAPSDGEPEELTRTREATRRVFHPSAPNAEGFNRKTFAKLLPLAEEPALKHDPYLTVVGHDPTVIFGENAQKVSLV